MNIIGKFTPRYDELSRIKHERTSQKEENQLLAEIHEKIIEKKILMMISSNDELLR